MGKDEMIDAAYRDYLSHVVLGVEGGLDAIKGNLDDCLVQFDGHYGHFTNPSFAFGFRPHTREEFIGLCKGNPGFSERWGIRIEERPLGLKDRLKLLFMKMSSGVGLEMVDGGPRFNPGFDPSKYTSHKDCDEGGIPTKMVTITNKGESIHVYE